LELPVQSIKPVTQDALFDLKSQIRQSLATAGANELLTYSFVHGDLLAKTGQNREQAFQLSNALSPDLQYFRLSLTPSLLDKVHPNIKAGYGQFALFEIGKSHIRGQQDRVEQQVPLELNALSLVITADPKAATNLQGAAFYQAKQYLSVLLKNLGVTDICIEPITDELSDQSVMGIVAAPYNRARSAVIKNHQGHAMGIVGEFKPSVAKALKLPAHTAGFEVGLHALKTQQQSSYHPLSKFPSVQQDISLRITADIDYARLHDELQAGLAELDDSHLQTRLEPLDIYQKDDVKHITFRLTATHHQKTLKSTEINHLLDNLAERVSQNLGAERL